MGRFINANLESVGKSNERSGVSQSAISTLSYIYSTKLRFVAISAKTIDVNRNCSMISVAMAIPLIRVRSTAPRKST